MRDTLRDSMNELMQFANNKPNKVTVKKYTLNNLPAVVGTHTHLQTNDARVQTNDARVK